ncbi:MAG: hypothetical protein ACFB2X_12605 [Rivularia sp. (in: cyanobacteria)]
MMNFSNIFKQLEAVLMSGLLTIALCLGVVPHAQANNIKVAAIAANPVVATTDNSKRIQAIASCLPAQLTIQNQDVGNRIARALSEMQNDQLERIFDITDTPKLSDAEVEFKTCLQQKGFTPQAELQNR